jgi:hypothetical protein
MFGYVIANKEKLSRDELLHYRACYCGLCRALGERCSQAGRLTLTYDMTFLILLLSSLYEPESANKRGRCLLHPFRQQPYWQNPFTEYAADMNIALAYHNFRDNWQDGGSIAAYGGLLLLRKKYRELKKKYSRQCGAMEEYLEELAQYEKEGIYDLDGTAGCFGRLLAEIFVFQEDRWAPYLRKLAAGLGGFIYIMDAYEDLPQDMKKNNYNPLRPLSKTEDYEARCKEILTLFISECAAEFEKLPLVRDIGILRNIIYSGVWTKYALLQEKRK